MAILTAKELKDRDSQEFPVDLGDGQQVLVRRPDLKTLLYEGIMPMPLISSVLTVISKWAAAEQEAGGESGVPISDLIANPATRKLVDVWVCAALVQPKVVMPSDPPQAVPDDTLLISDLTVATKTAVFDATFSFVNLPGRKAAVEAAKNFSDDGHGAGSGPDESPVLSPPVAATGD